MEPVDTLTGSALIKSSIALFVQQLASPEVQESLKSMKFGMKLLEELIATLKTVNNRLVGFEVQIDAEDVKSTWLNDVRGAVYDAEYLLKKIQSTSEAGSRISKDKMPKYLCCLNCFHRTQKGEMAENLEFILDRLEELAKGSDDQSHMRLITERPRRPALPSLLRDDAAPLYGRHDAIHAVKDLLLSSNANGKDLEVISIVGMGGMGKTTLTKSVYNDRDIQQHFDLKAWILVSPKFDAANIMESISASVMTQAKAPMNHNSLEEDDHVMDLDQLSRQLREKLMRKKLLLVLDDVWCRDGAQWEVLLLPLKGGAGEGSRIIITTRDQGIASVVEGTNYHLQRISDDDCWQLFSAYAFGGNYHQGDLSEFEQIRRPEIQRRCGGLPVAAAAIASLALQHQGDPKKWKQDEMNSVWDLQTTTVIAVLGVSYDHLPSRLKGCFAFCAILPKGYFFTKEELVLLWVAESLVHPKEVGYEYFEELVSRSLFQKVIDRPSYFVMNYFTSHLARSVSGEISVSLGGGDLKNISRKTKHLSFSGTRYADLKDSCRDINVEKLRTFFSVSKEMFSDAFYDVREFKDLLATCKHLRVLCLANISMLPDPMDNLKYLSYLNLSGTSVKRLPDSVCRLYCLEILILFHCRELVEFPSNLAKLTCLQHVDIEETSLQEMPPDMGKLKRLQTLTDFFVGEKNRSSIEELKELDGLDGKLHIWNLQKVDPFKIDVQEPLKEMQKLKKLELTWSGDSKDYLPVKVLDRLRPPQNVEVLTISGYGYEVFSNWVGDYPFSNLGDLRLSECRRCSSLPPLGLLDSLKTLLIEAFDELEIVGSEFYGYFLDQLTPFKSLESLTFERMPQWHVWREWRGEHRAFPCLNMLCIEKCPQLEPSFKWYPSDKILLNDQFHSLQLEKLPSDLHILTVNSFKSLDSILMQTKQLGCSLLTLQKIDITCDSVVQFPLENLTNLKQLNIRRCPNLESLGMHEKSRNHPASSSSSTNCGCPDLDELVVESCPKLKSIHCSLPCVENLIITYCDGRLESFSGMGCYAQTPMHICHELFADRKKWDLRDLPSLSSFIFGGYKEVESFPNEDMLLPSSLCSLVIRDLPNLKSLNYEELSKLTSLEYLEIENCPLLQSKPDEDMSHNWRKIPDVAQKYKAIKGQQAQR